MTQLFAHFYTGMAFAFIAWSTCSCSTLLAEEDTRSSTRSGLFQNGLKKTGPAATLNHRTIIAISNPAKEDESTNEYRCCHISRATNIDGTLNDPRWQDATPVKFMIPVTHEEPLNKTDARVLWDDDYFYFRGHRKQKDGTKG